MSRLHSILRLLIIAIAACLSSCIDSREEYWLEADGSGRAEITYHLPAAAAAVHGGESGLREMIAGFLKETPEFTNSACEVVIEEMRVRIKINIAFDSALALRDIGNGASMKTLPAAATHLAGEVTAGLHGRTLEYIRKISASKALPGAAFLSAAQLEGYRMTYIMHLPSVPMESNATRVENAGRTLVWDIPLSQALKSPVVTRFKMQIPIPWHLVATIAVPLSGVACATVLLRRRKQRNRFPLEI
jgi:hypothetical protein